MCRTTKPEDSRSFRKTSGLGKNHGLATGKRRDVSTDSMAEIIVRTFPCPPNSPTKRPSDFNARHRWPRLPLNPASSLIGHKRPVVSESHMYCDAIMNVGIHNKNDARIDPPIQTTTQLDAVFQKTDLLRYVVFSA